MRVTHVDHRTSRDAIIDEIFLFDHHTSMFIARRVTRVMIVATINNLFFVSAHRASIAMC